MNLGTYDHYAYALAALGGTFAAVTVVARLFARSASGDWLRSLRGVAPPFINIVGVLFGLTIAFIANDTWSAHDKATSAVHREADAIRGLRVLAEGLEAPVRGSVRLALDGYARASIDEWPLLGLRQKSRAATEASDALLRLTASAEVGRSAGSNVHALMLGKVSSLRDDRNLRIALSKTHLNPLKWLGMAALGLLTLLSIALVHVENTRAAVASMLLFAFSSAPMAAIVLIQGNPFQLPTFVSPAPIAEAIDGLAGEASFQGLVRTEAR